MRSAKRRVVVIVAVWITLVVAASAWYVAAEGDAAELRGRVRYGYRGVLRAQVARAARERPTVVWMGDSTILALRSISYPQLLHGVVPGISSMVMGVIGADFYTYYPLVADLLAVQRPGVLVMVAHLRLFASPSAPRETVTRNDVVSFLPSDGLSEALRLPFAVRGVTVPRLLLALLLRYETVERALYVVDGARARVSEAEVEWLGPNGIHPAGIGFRVLRNAVEGSDVPLSRDHPMVRMMEATVRLARQAGVRVVVVGTPIPFQSMRDIVGYDPDVYRARYGILRAAVEDAGGVFVDLHEALGDAMLQDPVGHFTPEGAALLADRLRPVVEREVQAALWSQFLAIQAAKAAAIQTAGPRRTEPTEAQRPKSLSRPRRSLSMPPPLRSPPPPPS